MNSNYPKIPQSLLSLESGCGVICGWMVLRRFRKKVSVKRFIRLCKFQRSKGTFAIALAVALKKSGLTVTFHTDRDNDKKPIEKIAYRAARKMKTPILPGPTIRDLKRYLEQEKVIIALFHKKDDVAHFSPIRKINEGEVLFDFPGEPNMSIRKFNRSRTAPGICRHTIVIG